MPHLYPGQLEEQEAERSPHQRVRKIVDVGGLDEKVPTNPCLLKVSTTLTVVSDAVLSPLSLVAATAAAPDRCPRGKQPLCCAVLPRARPPVFAGVIFAGSFRDAPNPGPAFGSNITDSV